MKCRGKINVKGKGSMVTYFLQPKTADDDPLPHQSSKITATSSEDCDLSEDLDQLHSDSTQLTQKRKSLCRQHNIFSSLTNKSITSHPSEHSMGGSFDLNDEFTMLNEKTKLLNDDSHHMSSGTIQAIQGMDYYPKSIKHDFKPNLPQHCTILKDSIESLEKLLKNDYSLSDLGTAKCHNATTAKVCIENTDISSPINPKLFTAAQTIHYANKNKLNGKSINTASNCNANSNETSVAAPTSAAPPTTDDQLKKTIKRTINFGDRSLMKLSKSFYPLSKEQVTIKLPNSKSMCVISSQNQNGTISLI